MKKINKFLAVASLATMCVSCGSLATLFSDPTMEIQLGMTRDEVIRLMGQPTFRSLTEDYEELGYSQNYSTSDYIRITNIQFVNGRVAAMDSYPLPKKAEVKPAPEK